MSKVKIQSNPSGTGTLTIAAPNTNTDRTLDLPDSSGALATAATFNATILGTEVSGDWAQASGTDPWLATVAVTGLLSTDEPIMDIDMSGVDFADVEDVQGDWALVYRAVAGNNSLTLYATDEPASDFDVILKVVR